MSHEQSVIEPADGLTVICGPNNIGKSSVVAALQLLCYNDTSTYVMRHGAKDCRVVVETSDGHRIEWARKNSPSYMIDGERFDRLKGGVPDQLHEILRMPRIVSKSGKQEFDLHFGEQKSPVFLLNESPGTIAQFFAASSDAGHLIAMQSLHKENIKSRKREKERLEAEKQELKSRLKMVSPVDAIRGEAAKCSEQFEAISVLERESKLLGQRITGLKQAAAETERLLATEKVLEQLEPAPELHNTSALDKTTAEIERVTDLIAACKAKADCLRQLQSPPELFDTSSLENSCTQIEINQESAVCSKAKLGALSDLKAPPVLQPVGPLQVSIDELERSSNRVRSLSCRFKVFEGLEAPPAPLPVTELAETIQRLENEYVTLTAIEKQSARLGSRYRSLHAEIEQWAKDNPSCPTCGGEIHSDQLICNLTGDQETAE